MERRPALLAPAARALGFANRYLPREVRMALARFLNPARHNYLAKGIDEASFLTALNDRQVEYVILAPPNGSAPLEVLLKDDHLAHLDDLLSEWPVGTPVGLFTPSGRPGTAFQPVSADGDLLPTIPLFPVKRAESLIRSGMEGSAKRPVLDLRSAFLVRAYRAAYLQAGDWEREPVEGRFRPTTALQKDLSRLASAADITLPEQPAPTDLDAVLREHGWRPPIDLLEKASCWMPWLKDVLDAGPPEPPGLTVVFIRERAIEAGLRSEIIRYLSEKGFDPLVILDLSPEQRRIVETTLRGGNWKIGGFPTDAGPPITMIVALDLLPVQPSAEALRKQPLIDNEKIVSAKQAIRDEVNAGSPSAEHYNPVHSSDNSNQAWHTIHLVLPECAEEIRRLVKERRRSFDSSKVGKDLTRFGCRSRIELVEHAGMPAIRKTFRPGTERFKIREAAVMTRLAGCPPIPKLLEEGPDYLVMEYVEGDVVSRRWPHPLPLSKVRQLRDALRTVVEHGFDPIDLAPDANVIFTPSGVRFIDFEFWRECDPATPVHECYCLAGLPKSYEGDRPPGVMWLFDPYPAKWFQHTGLDLHSFLYDPPWVQMAKRAVRVPARYMAWAPRAVARKAARHVKRMVQP